MPSTILLAKRLALDYPQFQISTGETFQWVPETHTITYLPDGVPADLLHELAHGLLGHRDFTRDITLLEMERDAWYHATTALAPHYGITISETIVQDALDTYREWLHSRSICPECGATGIQSSSRQYRCLACLTNWRVNDARHCALRRYKTT